MKAETVFAAILGLSLAACDEISSWHTDEDDGLLDGAIRVSTSAIREERVLKIRCFSPSVGSEKRGLDLRYTIQVPLLRRLEPELNKFGPVELVVQVDGRPIATLKARAVAHDFGLSFLADLPVEHLAGLASARDTIIVMPRQNAENLDEIIRFRVGGLAKTLVPVRMACGLLATPATVAKQ
jgi:hypothetical protein